MDSNLLMKDAAPFAAMVLVEAGEVLLTTLTKAAMNRGISNYVYAVYYNSLGVLVLLPYFIFHTLRKRNLPITFSLLRKCFLLGFLGRCLVMFSYVGIEYSSPALTAALGNLTPVFTFLIALVFRMEKLDTRSWSSQAKSIGTIITVTGAFVVTLYKGPVLLSDNTSGKRIHLNFLLSMSKQSKWIFGGLFLALGYLFVATWSVLQAHTVKKYPDKTTVVFFFMLFGSIQCAVFSFMLERDLNTWILHHNIEMIAIFYSAIFGTVIRYSFITWCLKEKGPLYVALFKPLGMIIAEIFGIFFFGDKLHLGRDWWNLFPRRQLAHFIFGSVIGVVIISGGFYMVMWGNAKEEEKTQIDQNTPLLQKKPISDEHV